VVLGEDLVGVVAEAREERVDALLSLGCSIICWRRLTDSRSF
jgi:hypothetical protein